MQNQTEIPVYSPEGCCVGTRSLESIQRLSECNMVTVVKNRKGFVMEAHFRQADGRTGIKPTAHMGQAYSVNESLETGHHAWKHKGLPKGKADSFVRSIFRAVQLDCMASRQTA